VTSVPAPRRNPLLRAVQLLSLAAVAGLLALLVWRIVDVARGSRLVAAVRSGKQPSAPEFRLPVLWARGETWPKHARRALRDGELSLRELRGYPVVVNFWASWCIPCKEEAPRLAASARAHTGIVAFVGINVQDFKSSARAFLTRFGAPYVSVHAGGGKSGIYTDYGLTGVPETYWLDARGRIVAHYAGGISRRQLENGIRKALASK
jgi:cytochrome c biogenesis protein CcmG, thiol:disulfide interchange protein DsbE